MKVNISGIHYSLFRLSKLGDFPNEFFIDRRGFLYYKEQHKEGYKLGLLDTNIFCKAVDHVDFETDTRH